MVFVNLGIAIPKANPETGAFLLAPAGEGDEKEKPDIDFSPPSG